VVPLGPERDSVPNNEVVSQSLNLKPTSKAQGTAPLFGKRRMESALFIAFGRYLGVGYGTPCPRQHGGESGESGHGARVSRRRTVHTRNAACNALQQQQDCQISIPKLASSADFKVEMVMMAKTCSNKTACPQCLVTWSRSVVTLVISVIWAGIGGELPRWHLERSVVHREPIQQRTVET
jgi:hypothetical protein